MAVKKVTTISSIIPNTLRAWLAITLLGLISSFEVVKTIHVEHHHAVEPAVCSVVDEADACHRSIVHLDTTAGCKHTQHVEKLVAACEICDALISSFVFEVVTEFDLQNQFDEINQIAFTQEKSYSTSVLIPALRGPPVS